MPSKDPVLRRIHARSAAYALHSHRDSREVTRPARSAFLAQFTELVDPTGELRRSDPSEAERRSQMAIRAHFQAMAAKSVEVRSKRKT